MNFLGKITKVRSNKGEVVYTSPLSATPTLEIGAEVTLKSEKYQKECIVEGHKEFKGNFAVKFTGVDSISDALKLVGYSIYGAGSPDLPDETQQEDSLDDFLVKDLDGTVWGNVVAYDDVNLNKLLEVEGDTETYYVPFADAIIKDINYDEAVITIDPPPGLMDLNKTTLAPRKQRTKKTYPKKKKEPNV